MDSSEDDWFIINEDSVNEATNVPLAHTDNSAVQQGQPQILVAEVEGKEPQFDWNNTEPVLIDFENACTTPSSTERELSPLESKTETDGTGNNSTSTAYAAASAPAVAAASQQQNKKNEYFHLLVATLVTSSFTLGALAAFLAIQYQGRNARNPNRKNKFSGPSGRRKDGGNIATSSFILERLEHLDQLDDNDDHVVVDFREEVKRLLLGSGRSRL